MSEKTYKALKPIGRFNAGDIVGGLSDKQIATALQDGVIAFVEPAAEPEQAAIATPKSSKVSKEPTNG